jgi:hypothetical protein
MATDVLLDQANNRVVLAGNVISTGTDLMLDSPVRHTGGERHRTAGLRRALVHDFGDGLTVNWDGDYPGGVTINGSIITLNTLTQDSPGAGDIRLIYRTPDQLDQDGNPRVEGFNETIFLGQLIATLRDEISSLKDRVAALEK